MYGRAIPLVALDQEQFRRLRAGADACIRADGTVQVLK
jgi:hypothetical protein